MRIGKISENVLKRSILKQIKVKREEVMIGAGIGTDCAILAFENDEAIALTIDPMIINVKEQGPLCVYKALNNIAVAGAETVGIMTSAILPTQFYESDIKEMMIEIQKTCEKFNVETIGGHTQITDTVNKPVITITAIGKVLKSKILNVKNIKPGQDIVLSKWVGLEGSFLLATTQKKKLLTKYPEQFIREALGYDALLSIIPEAATAIKSGVVAMHDVTESGIFGALWEVAESAGVGLTVDLKKIPIKQETVEICEFFGLNPYELLSGGALIMVSDKGQNLADALHREKIPATVIGVITDSKDRLILNEDEKRFLERPKADEIYKVMK
jgi:hydrogenase expression/formation protein HypE